MRHTWRWFGPKDSVTLSDARQAGALGIVSALHHIPPGQVWPRDDIARHKAQIEAAGLTWDVVESLPVSEDIRAGGPSTASHIANWITSLRNLAAEGVPVICYNFMPALDWTRTDLAAPRPSGATALRYDYGDFIAFDLHILKRTDAEKDYSEAQKLAAQTRAAEMSDDTRERLINTVLAGLPGAMEHWSLETFRDRLSVYAGMTAEDLRANLRGFLTQVVPVAEELGVRLCCHPDDPPWPLFGLPRVMSTEADYAWLVNAVPSLANGITFCTGSLGARGDNDLPGMMARFGPHVHFLHLRNVRREAETVPCSFFEDDHLDGSTDMVAVIAEVVREEKRRATEGRPDAAIPMRPDHGQAILSDQLGHYHPGYPAVGRLKGLAELRGVERALRHRA